MPSAGRPGGGVPPGDGQAGRGFEAAGRGRPAAEGREENAGGGGRSARDLSLGLAAFSYRYTGTSKSDLHRYVSLQYRYFPYSLFVFFAKLLQCFLNFSGNYFCKIH